ncbi:maleylpyruvate isomerase N-terminal domain-containing protein [Streptomyces sp. ID05-04B]|uniref:maleylpyruvate isomerase N-terminal domain-containing protein n=1 Tax=unclassified Streptomyces TaxID=2593676 RepID=UPI00131F06A9|nr:MULTISPECIES: maleylpyruvate isomerase N-terminal domain-containing protein [unclassified Streptomyces]MDX5564290.1 maleylpyruvate isomerase N-terminal domain-containing protein [Streptomyces sp. ID05-04B]
MATQQDGRQPPGVIAAFLDTAEVTSRLLRSPVLAERWEQPSALAQFRVSGLAGHLARAVFNVERWLAEPPQAGGTPIDAVVYFLSGTGPAPHLENAVPRRIREVGEQEAAGGPAVLVEAFDAARARLAAQLPTMPLDRHVGVFAHVLPLDQCLLTRLVELVVHLDDLAVSLAAPTPSVPVEATDAVIACLTRIAVARHGVLPVMRTLARRERSTDPIAAF